MSFTVGNIIAGYEIIKAIGQGGMGQIYKVKNVVSGRLEAMKILLPNLETDPEVAARFIREIQILAALHHPNIAALQTAQQINNQLIMIMEFVQGVTLKERLRTNHLPLQEGLDYIRQVLSALAYAHQRNIIHRDVKPGNIMMTPEGAVKLMDFGIAKIGTASGLTKFGMTMGSVHYMSPEQVNAETGSLDCRTDLYSTGVVLYEVVTRRRPFEADTDYAIMAAHLYTPPLPPVELEPDLPPPLNEIILKALAKDRNKRFQTAQEFLDALDSLDTRDRNVGHIGIAVPQSNEQTLKRTRPTAGAEVVAGFRGGL